LRTLERSGGSPGGWLELTSAWALRRHRAGDCVKPWSRQVPSAQADVPAQDRFQVQDGSAVQRLEMAHAHRPAIDFRDLDRVQADGIRTVGRTCAEDALLLSRGISTRVNAQHVAPRAVEPGDEDYLVARPQIAEPFEPPRPEDQPGLRRAFVGLARGRSQVGQRRLDSPDGSQLEDS